MSNDYIPYDIVYCILAKLSVKELVKLKCLSKLWLDTIQSPAFAKFQIINHSFNSKSQNLLCANVKLDSFWPTSASGFMSFPEMFRGDKKFKSLEIHCPGIFYEKYNVVGTSQGILCIQYTKGSRVYLCNPWIRECRKLPRCHLGPLSEQRHWLYNVYGFGYDELNDDFKVVKLSGVGSKIHSVPFTNVGKIYSLKSNTWKSIENIPYMIEKGSYGFLFNHSLHWMFTHHRESILSLDIRTGKHTLLSLPDDLIKVINLNFRNIVEFNGYLCISNGVMNGFEIWLMKDYGVKDSWIKLEIFAPLKSLCKGSSLIKYIKNKNEERMFFSVLGVPFLFDFHEQKLYSPENIIAKDYFFSMESLVPLWHIDKSGVSSRRRSWRSLNKWKKS